MIFNFFQFKKSIYFKLKVFNWKIEMSKKAPTKEELIAIFNIIDKDHSGSVDVNELYEALGIL